LKLEIDVADRGRHEIIDIAVKAFELSQTLRTKWVTADYAAKRRILEIVCLNCTLDDVNLCATMRKPFDLLAKGLVSKDSRDDCQAFEHMIPEFVDVLLSPGPYLHQIQRFARTLDPALALSDKS
jgi:hypothetical protein